MLHRLLAVIAYPAHRLNQALADLLGRVGLGRIPAALIAGVALLALTISTASATLAADDARPEPQPSTIANVVDGRVASAVWIEFDAQLLDGPHRAPVEVSWVDEQPTIVERVHYLVADPLAPDRTIIVRYAEPIPALEAGSSSVRLDGTITQDPFNMRGLIEEWGITDLYPEVTFSESRLIAYAFSVAWEEPSWLGTLILGIGSAVILAGALIRQPVLRRTRGEPTAGETPIRLDVHGDLPTPRGAVRLHGTPAQLERMNVEEVARTRWRYWGAGLGDVRREVEDAVRAHGRHGERLVIHGRTRSVIWPIEPGSVLRVEAADAYLGLRQHPAIRVHGDGAVAILTFADEAGRDAALAELHRVNGGS